MNIIELFAGVGCQTQALKNIGIEHKVVGISEVDKYAISAYNQLHGETFNFGDIRKIEKLPEVDMWTYSFPCQDISVAGYQKGIKKGTRSGLLSEVERLLEVSEKPKYLLLENVKNLVGKKFRCDFDKWLNKLTEMGYTNYWKVINAKDCGIPQNRERVFVVSILGEHKEFVFPEKMELKLKLKDLLDEVVDEKFYLKQEKVTLFLKQGNVNPSGKGMNGAVNTKDMINTLTTNKGEGPKILQVGNIVDTGNFKNPQRGRIYSEEGLSPSLNCVGGGGLEPKIIKNEPEKILVREATKQGYKEAYEGDSINLEHPSSKTRRGRVGKQMAQTLNTCSSQVVVIGASRGRSPLNTSDRTKGIETVQRLEINKQNISSTITTVRKDNLVVERNNLRIRKLTPIECWRLMGWKDEQFNRIKGISNSQLYKQSGNGIVINVLEGIFKNMFSKVEKIK